ncbi:MAG: hypothetical protein AB7K09_13900 [Planctomycetota bacterium]
MKRTAIATTLLILFAALASAQDPAAVDAAKKAAEAWRVALVAAQADTLWELASDDTHKRMADDLAELQERLRTVPADRLDDTIDGLAVTARKILDLKDGKAFFAWLISRISQRERDQINKLAVGTVTVEGSAATLAWTGPEGTSLTAAAMPQRATLKDGKWRIEVDE